ncbi:MAG: hypothetical protein NVSMB13_02380 [Mycobacteriales bacterium]
MTEVNGISICYETFGGPDGVPTGVTVPTLVFDGLADPLVGVDGGRATAAAIPGSELVLVEGMANDLPREVWQRLYDAIDSAVRRAVAV